MKNKYFKVASINMVHLGNGGYGILITFCDKKVQGEAIVYMNYNFNIFLRVKALVEQ